MTVQATETPYSDRWQREKIHWHLYREQHAVNSKERFLGKAAERLQRREQAVARTPEECVDWIEQYEREAATDLSDEVLATQGVTDREAPKADVREYRLRAAYDGNHVSGGMYPSPKATAVDLWAVAMPLAECSRH